MQHSCEQCIFDPKNFVHIVQQRIESDYLPGFFERNGIIAGNFLTDFTKSVKHIQYVAVESIVDLRFEFYHLLTLWINMRHLFQGVLKPVKSLE